jgi:acyl-CoA reductase-like NAD-dependent aldehyde dehydrogenase
MLINGKLMEKPEQIDIVNPFNSEIIDTVPHGSREDAKKAIEAANISAKTLKNVSSREISESLYEIYEELKKNSNIFAKLITIDCGKPIKESK